MTAHKPTAVEALRGLEASMASILASDHRRAGPAALIPEWLTEVRSALAAQPEESAHPTDGWVTVPREPTEEMLHALAQNWGSATVDTYRAMLSAAPAAPGREEWLIRALPSNVLLQTIAAELSKRVQRHHPTRDEDVADFNAFSEFAAAVSLFRLTPKESRHD